MTTKSQSIFSAIFFLGAILVGAYWYFQPPRPQILATTSTAVAIPTPSFPFEELTIPYLRRRSYQSSLASPVLFQKKDSYTSFLTSYDSDGLKINALLTIPKGSPPTSGWPAVVFVHGYVPPKQYQTTKNYTSFVDAFAKSGMVVLKIDLRGHGNSQGDPGGGYYSSDYVIDTINAYHALQKMSGVDPQKISLWGHSMAGNIVFRSMIARPEIKKIVIWAGAVYTYEDMIKFRITDTSYKPLPSDSPTEKKRLKLIATYGTFTAKNSFWKQMVPTNYLDGVADSMQIHHAQNDAVVNIGYSRILNTLLGTSKITHELFEYPTGGHNFTSSSFTEAIKRTTDFIKE